MLVFLAGTARTQVIAPNLIAFAFKGMIRTYEALRGANPDEIAHHFAPSRSLHRVAQQPSMSPTIIKLLGVRRAVFNGDSSRAKSA